MKKIDKEFCLSDDSVNVYGYRCLTAGCELDKFKPAIGFLMHERDRGVAVRWEDFRIAGGKIFAKPVVNDTIFPDLAEQIESGFYAGASVGKIVSLEMSEDAKYKLEGQTGPTVLRWFPRECSIVDIPGNYSALAQLYDEKDNVLKDLSDTIDNETKLNKQMDKILWTAAMLSMIGLADNASDATIEAALHDLADRASRTDKAEKALADLKASVNKDKVAMLLAQGLADKKLTQALSDKLGKDYAERPDDLKSLIDDMPVQTLVVDDLKDGKTPEKYQGKTYKDLYLSGELEDVKKNYPDLYQSLKSKC